MPFDEEQDAGRRIDQDFSKEDYRFKAKIISSEYKDKITSLINQYDFSQSCKIQLMNIINVAFDPNAMLARNESIIPRKIQLSIALNLAVVAMDESDTQNAGLINVVTAIEDAFSDFVSRSIGGKERDNITKQEITSHQSYSGLPTNNPGMEQERRGFRAPWNRGERR
jgi:hypothetical protein